MRVQLDNELITNHIPDEDEIAYHFEEVGRYITYIGVYDWSRYYVTIPFTDQRQWDEFGSFRHIQTIYDEIYIL